MHCIPCRRQLKQSWQMKSENRFHIPIILVKLHWASIFFTWCKTSFPKSSSGIKIRLNSVAVNYIGFQQLNAIIKNLEICIHKCAKRFDCISENAMIYRSFEFFFYTMFVRNALKIGNLEKFCIDLRQWFVNSVWS